MDEADDVSTALADRYGATLLHAAAYDGDGEEVMRLLNAGAEVDSEDVLCKTPLAWAAEAGHETIVRELLRRGASPERDRPEYDETPGPLQEAAAGGHVGVVKVLIDAGAEIDEESEYISSALELAARNGHVNVVEILLDRGARTDPVDPPRKDVVHEATANGHVDVVALLIERGVARPTHEGLLEMALDS